VPAGETEALDAGAPDAGTPDADAPDTDAPDAGVAATAEVGATEERDES
jgi:hypothetical protein